MRTGLGGQKVVLDGGAFVLPIVHDVIPVNMNTLRLEVARGRDKALITQGPHARRRDRRVLRARRRPTPTPSPPPPRRSASARMEPEQLKELVEGKFVDALRTAAAEMTMEELHEKRGDYVRRVRERGGRGPAQERPRARIGLADPARPDRAWSSSTRRNAFDAEGLTRLTEQIERRKKHRNDIEQDTMIADPQQEPRGREAVARHRPRERVRAPGAGARGRDRARRASAPSWRASGPQREQEAERAADRRPQSDRARRASLRADACEAGAHRQGARDRSGRDRAPPGAGARRAAARDRRRAEQSKAQSRGPGGGRHGARAGGGGGGEGLHRARDRDGRAQRRRSS